LHFGGRNAKPTDIVATTLIYAGKPVEELSREELIKCALHFRDAHVKTHLDMAKISRRMKEMERALTKEQIAKLDWWLEHMALPAMTLPTAPA
jgi:hypothetical protein